jgi:hypothetical protein
LIVRASLSTLSNSRNFCFRVLLRADMFFYFCVRVGCEWRVIRVISGERGEGGGSFCLSHFLTHLWVKDIKNIYRVGEIQPKRVSSMDQI